MGMAEHALTYSSLVNRLKFIGVTVVNSPPAPVGFVYFFGKKGPAFPFTKGPVYPMKARQPGELIPPPMIKRLLRHLSLEEVKRNQFWAIEEHGQPTAKESNETL